MQSLLYNNNKLSERSIIIHTFLSSFFLVQAYSKYFNHWIGKKICISESLEKFKTSFLLVQLINCFKLYSEEDLVPLREVFDIIHTDERWFTNSFTEVRYKKMLTAKLKEVATILSDDYLNQSGATYSLSTEKDYHDVLTHSSAFDPMTISGISIPQKNLNRLQNISSEY